VTSLTSSVSSLWANYHFFLTAPQHPVDQGFLIHEVSILHNNDIHFRWDCSGRVISSSQRPLPANTTLTTDIHAPGGIRTHNLSRRLAAGLHLRPRDHWDRLNYAFRPDIYGHKISLNHLNSIVQPDNLFGAWSLFEHPFQLNGLVIASCVSWNCQSYCVLSFIVTKFFFRNLKRRTLCIW